MKQMACSEGRGVLQSGVYLAHLATAEFLDAFGKGAGEAVAWLVLHKAG